MIPHDEPAIDPEGESATEAPTEQGAPSRARIPVHVFLRAYETAIGQLRTQTDLQGKLAMCAAYDDGLTLSQCVAAYSLSTVCNGLNLLRGALTEASARGILVRLYGDNAHLACEAIDEAMNNVITIFGLVLTPEWMANVEDALQTQRAEYAQAQGEGASPLVGADGKPIRPN